MHVPKVPNVAQQDRVSPCPGSEGPARSAAPCADREDRDRPLLRVIAGGGQDAERRDDLRSLFDDVLAPCVAELDLALQGGELVDAAHFARDIEMAAAAIKDRAAT